MAARLVVTAIVVGFVTAGITTAVMQKQVEEIREDLALAQTEAETYAGDLEEAEEQAEEAEAELDKLKRETQKMEDAAASALDVQGDLQTELEAAYAAIQQLQTDLARATRRGPSSIRCVDGLSVSEIVSGEIDPCQEWEADY